MYIAYFIEMKGMELMKNKNKLFLFLLSAALAFILTGFSDQTKVYAKTYYVSPNGFDCDWSQSTNDTGSIDKPLKTLKNAINHYMKPGDTLIVRGGTYRERIDIYGNGSSTSWYTIKNYPNEVVTLYGDGDDTEKANGLVFHNSSYWIVSGLNITNYTGSGIWLNGEGGDNINHIILKNLNIYGINGLKTGNNGTEGIFADGHVSYCTIQNSKIHDISLPANRTDRDHGIYIGYGVSHLIIDGNEVYNNIGAGIQFYGEPNGGSYCTISNNKIYNNHGYGVTIFTNAVHNVIYRNSFYGNVIYDLRIHDSSNNNVIKNNVFGSINSDHNVDMENNSDDNIFSNNCYSKSNISVIYAHNKSMDFSVWQKNYSQDLGGNKLTTASRTNEVINAQNEEISKQLGFNVFNQTNNFISPSKVWNIILSSPVDKYSVNNNNVWVQDALGNLFSTSVKLSSDGKTIVVSPNTNYNSNTVYCLYINNLKSMNGQTLSPIKMSFLTY